MLGASVTCPQLSGLAVLTKGAQNVGIYFLPSVLLLHLELELLSHALILFLSEALPYCLPKWLCP